MDLSRSIFSDRTVQRRGSRVRPSGSRIQLRRIRRAARRADRLRARADRMAARSGTAIELAPAPLLAVPGPVSAAFDDAAALLDLWDSTEGGHRAGSTTDGVTDSMTDTAEWTFEDATPAVTPPATIDLSDSPKLIMRPEPVAPQQFPEPSPREAPIAPAHRSAVTDPRLAEPILAAATAAVANLTAWATVAPPSVWFPLALLPAAGLLALLAPGRDVARVVRALVVLGAAAALPAMSTAMTPAALLVVLAAAAIYPLITGARAAATIIGLAVAALATPLVVEAVRSGVHAFVSSLFDPVSGAQVTARIALTAGMVVAGLLGTSAMAARRAPETETTAGTPAPVADAADPMDDAHLLPVPADLPGREVLVNRLTWILDRHATDPRADAGYPAGLGLVEIDRFAALNETLGASATRRIADEVGRRLRAALPDHELVARLAPHQFGVLMLEATQDDCADLARDLTQSLAEPVEGLSITCSVGTAIHDEGFPGDHSAESMLLAAAEAVRAATAQGRSSWVMFDQAVHAHAESQAGLELQLRKAISTGAISACYQPLLALGHGDDDDRIVGAEALPCWTGPDGTDVPASRFMALAGDLGLGGQLGLHLIEQALDALLEWRQEGVGVDQVWVNLAPGQLRDPDLAHEISARLAVRGLSSSCLVLEVSAAQLQLEAETDQAISSLSMLRSLGVAIALDDFGRSGTSLSALRSLPISAIKVDHQLASELSRPDRQDAVTRSITTLCHTLGLRVVLEGIETMVQLSGARMISADAVQGHAIARPMAAADITNLLSLRLPREFRLQ